MDSATQWWWFNADYSAEKHQFALNWETLRRTIFYPALWRKCSRERSAFQPKPGQPKPSETLRLLHLFQRTKLATSDQIFRMVLDGFDPDLTWLELTERQRLSVQGCAIGDGEAVNVTLPNTLPRQVSLPSSPPDVSLCEIDRDAAGHFILTKGTASPLAEVTRFPFFQKLKLKTPGRYLCAYFDTRLGRQAILAALENQKPFWTPDPVFGNIQFNPDDVYVIPSDMPPFAILLAPARCDAARLQAAFHTQLEASQYRNWLARCVKHWKTVKVRTPTPRRNPDGTLQLNESGRVVYEPVTRYLFDPEKHLPPAQQAHKSASRDNLWLGLAANDVVRKRMSLFKKTPETDCLVKQTKAWDGESKRAAASAKRDFSKQRQAQKRAHHELRNHQISAKKRLDELDKHFGRLDKNLDHWITENAKLARSGVFVAAAGDNRK
jgi:hypothetical protein